jgi:hypothetical protein
VTKSWVEKRSAPLPSANKFWVGKRTLVTSHRIQLAKLDNGSTIRIQDSSLLSTEFRRNHTHATDETTRIIHPMDENRNKNCNDPFSALSYTDVLLLSQFVATPRGDNRYLYCFTEMLSAGAVPVILSDDWVLPFQMELKPNWETACAVRSFSEQHYRVCHWNVVLLRSLLL